MRKSISLVLVLSMLLAAMLGVTSVAEEPAAAKLDITYANLMFSDSVYPLFAVDYTAVYTGDKAEANALAAIKLEVYRNGELVDTLKPTTEVAAPQVGTIAFKQESFGFKNMGDIYTYRAVNGKAENSSDDEEYSVLEYALESSMLGNDKLTTVVEKMIAVGAAAQTAFDYTDYDYDLAKKYSVTKLAGGATFADGTTKKIFTEGDTATYVASHKLAAEKVVWYNNTLELQSTESTYTASYGESQTLFAVPAAQAVDMGNSYATKGSQLGYTKVGASIASIVGDFANNGNTNAESKFTMTFTLATNSATSMQINLRNSEYRNPANDNTKVTESSSVANRQKANVNLFRGAGAKGYLGPRYSAKGVCVNNTDPLCSNIAPLSTAASGTVGEYITYSIVFDISGQADCPACTKATGCTNCNTDGVSDGKTYTMAFYVNGEHKLTTILPILLSYELEVDGVATTKKFFDENLQLYFSANPFSNLYIKHFAITAGDINDYK